jgi:glycine oxidase
MNTPDVLIIGAGIIGCSLGRELARAGSRVLVVDRGSVGGESSSAAAGLLSPTLVPTPAGPFVDLCTQSASLYEPWVKELLAEGGGDVGFRRTGVLSVALDPAEADPLQRWACGAVSSARRVEWLGAAELRRLEPNLTEQAAGAVYFPDDGHVEPARLVRQVARVAELAGVVIRDNEPVQRLENHGQRITTVHTHAERYQPGTVVLTAGAWCGELAQAIGLRLPTRPVKGQMLMADCRVPPVRRPVAAGEALLVPWPDGRLALGVTVEEAAFDDRVRLDALYRILRRTIALAPAVGRLAFSHAWAGLRPATPDGLPYMGPVPPWDNLWISAGHFRKGTLLAPLCARLLAASIRSGRAVEELAPFLPTRPLAGVSGAS